MKILTLICFMLSLSSPVFSAEESKPGLNEQVQFMLNCDPTAVLPAKIIAGLNLSALLLWGDEVASSQLEKLSSEMSQIRTCEKLLFYYESIKVFAMTRVSLDLEEYFKTTEGTEYLDEAIKALKGND